MKTLLISFCICVVLSLGAFCQDKLDVDIRLKDKASLSYHGKPGSDKFLPGQEMKIVNVFTSADGFVYIVNYQSEKYELPFGRLDNIEFLPASDLLGEWEIQMVKYGALMNVAYKGMQFDLRKDLNEEAYDFTSTLENNEFLFRDDYLEDYLQKLVHRMHPCILQDGRPGIICVRVVKNQNPNAYSFSNGSIFITTGLLSAINSEEELMAVLAHEIAHFVLDHDVSNINLQVDLENRKQQRAAFWSAVAAAAGTVAEIYLGAEQNIYFGGNLVKSASAIAYSIAISVSDRMGMNYSEDQEQAANATAQAILGYLSVPPDAYSSALNKIAGYLHSSGNYYSLMGSFNHPPVYNQSSDTLGSTEIKFYNDNYNMTISFVTTFNAALEYTSKNYIACERLVDQNIKAGIAVEEDYILKAMVMRILYSSIDKNLEAIDYLNTAKSLDIVPSNAIYKQEGITYLGLGQKAKAIESFNQYLEAISREIESIKAYYIDYINDSQYKYWSDEMNWTRKMIYKLNYR